MWASKMPISYFSHLYVGLQNEQYEQVLLKISVMRV